MSKPSDVRFEVARTEVMSRCLRCGAMVGDERRHREWHSKLADIVRAIDVLMTFGAG